MVHCSGKEEKRWSYISSSCLYCHCLNLGRSLVCEQSDFEFSLKHGMLRMNACFQFASQFLLI
jgi:hypothetical protein